MPYTHIKTEDRSVIATLLDEGRSDAYIARKLGVHRSTIGREIARNRLKPRSSPCPVPPRPAILDTDCRHSRGSGLAQDKYEAAASYDRRLREARRHNRFYKAGEAAKKTKARRRAANRLRIRLVHGSNSWLEQYVRKHLIKDQWSPEQIAGTLRRNHSVTIYPQTIYGYIYAATDRKRLVKHLRHGGNPCRRRHGTNGRAKARREALPSIRQRPKVVEERSRVGDMEGDTIVGLDHTDRVLTHVDRACGECALNLVLGYNAEKIVCTTERNLKRNPCRTRTITYDRGNEFAAYEQLQKRTGAKVYFADAYHSWERGSSENLNGLVRQYLPKRTDFKAITPRQLKTIERKLNNRPRKRYNYRQRQYLQARQSGDS